MSQYNSIHSLFTTFKREEALEKPTLLVCPTSVLGNWEREVKKFAPNLKVLQYHGDKRPKGKAFQTAVKDQNIVITSYSLVHRDLKSLQDVSWQIVALDEAQNIRTRIETIASSTTVRTRISALL